MYNIDFKGELNVDNPKLLKSQIKMSISYFEAITMASLNCILSVSNFSKNLCLPMLCCTYEYHQRPLNRNFLIA